MSWEKFVRGKCEKVVRREAFGVRVGLHAARLLKDKLYAMRLYMVRHGQTAWNLEEKAQGHTDIPLDPTGLEQAKCLGEMLEDEPIQVIWSSDLQRSSKTAEIVGARLKVPVEVMPILRERSFGDWEGLPYTEVGRRSGVAATEQGLRSLYEACPPGGESLQMAWERMSEVTEMLAKEPRNTLIVSHGGVSALMLSQLVQGDLKTSRAFRFSNCAVTELMRRGDATFQLVRFNDTSHLASAEPIKHAAIR